MPILALFLYGTAGAQAPTEADSRLLTADTAATSSLNAGGSELVVLASRNEKVAKARFARRERELTFDLTLSAPFDESDDTTVLATSDALSDQAGLELGISRFFWKTVDARVHQREICDAYKRRLTLKELVEKYPKPVLTKESEGVQSWIVLLTALRKPAGDAQPRLRELLSEGVRTMIDKMVDQVGAAREPELAEADAILEELDKLLADPKLLEKLPVPPGDRRAALTEALATDPVPGDELGTRLRNRLVLETIVPGGFWVYPEYKRFNCDTGGIPEDLNAEFWRPAGVVVLGFTKLKLGQKTYKFLAKSTFTPDEAKHTAAAITGGVGIVTKTLELIGLSYRHERTYKAGKARQICTPVESTSATECRTLPVGVPGGTNTDRVQLELRKFITGKGAINPRIAYEFGEGVTTAELAVYFLPDKDGRLIGGISGSWDSKERSVAATFFVGVPLSLGF